MRFSFRLPVTTSMLLMSFLISCNKPAADHSAATDTVAVIREPLNKDPLIEDIYTADPSAHVFNGKIFIYPSHDIESGVAQSDNGDHFDMKDYHVLSMDSIGGPVIDHGVSLDIKDIPWAGRQLWAPDAAFANSRYYLFFPAKDKTDIFRIGVATSNTPEGPFIGEKDFIPGSYSMDPAVFKDDDGQYYLYFGGIWGGQLQRWQKERYDAKGSNTDLKQDDAPAISPRVARLSPNLLKFAEPVREVSIVDEHGKPIVGGDHDRRFFEASWMHRYNGKYYFSYSTGDTHLICYATGDSPYGPFTYRGIVLKPVKGWTSHHSIIELNGKWYLFYHDTAISGKTHLRNVRVTELHYNPDGSIQTVDAQATSK